MRFTLNEQIIPILQRFRLDHLAKLGIIKIDRDLITAMVERWRRETHTFHLSVGEMTITLEDVSCLWGLPINGYSITSFADDNWEEDVLHVFGHVGWRTPHNFADDPTEVSHYIGIALITSRTMR
jgi:Plant mobile domain